MIDKSELRRLCSDIQNCGGIARLMKGGLFSKWIELVSPASILSLLDECDKAEAGRDAALAELDALRSRNG